MGYASRGRKPIERASKIAHAEIINNKDVAAYLDACELPTDAAPLDLQDRISALPAAVDTSDVRAVVAIDGGYTETYVREEYPSASVAFFTLGPLLFELADLRGLDAQRFIAPEDLARLKNLERYSLTLPTRGIRRKGEPTLASTIRRTVYDFFARKRGPEEDPLLASLSWLLFRGWDATSSPNRVATLERCPTMGCTATGLEFRAATPTEYPCPACGAAVFLTDVFRLHERIDEELGAGAILAYVMTALEQLVLVHVIRIVYKLKPAMLAEILFLKDGPLAFFGLTAPLYRPMRELATFLLTQVGPDGAPRPLLRLAGLEKSGAFVEHALRLQAAPPEGDPPLRPGSILLCDNEYIYRYIVPGDPQAQVFGVNTYYGQKLIFRAASGETYVVTVPAVAYSPNPSIASMPDLHKILALVAELRCSMFDNALIPIALANKLVSLSDFPSQRILTAFARRRVQ